MVVYKLIILFAMLLASNANHLNGQQNYYVSLTGDNTNVGTSINAAWNTIQHAMDEVAPNSIVHILEGTYNEKFAINVSGTVDQPILLRNYESDEVTIDGSGISSSIAIIELYDQSYVIIQGLKIRNNQQLDAQGISINGSCQGVEIRNCEISNIHFSANPGANVNENTNSQPLIVYGDNVNSITDLVISDNVIRDSRTGYSEALAINGNVDGFVVSNNTVFNISNIGIDIIGHEGTSANDDQARNGIITGNTVYNCKSPYATAGGIYVDGGKDLIIERNRVYNCQWGIEIGCENKGKSTSNVVVRNNLIYENEDAGLAIGGYNFPSESGKVVDCTFSNNTCFGNDKNDKGIGEITAELNLTYTENCTLKNNIFYAKNPANLMIYQDPVGSQNLTLDHNLYFSDTEVEYEYNDKIYNLFLFYAAATGQDNNSSNKDPIFEDLLNQDFHLTSGSPAIDSGDPAFDNNAGVLDFEGNPRVVSNRLDIGAFEFSNSTVAKKNLLNKIILFPNPTTSDLSLKLPIGSFKVEIVNQSGNTVQVVSIVNSDLDLNLLELSSGIYIMHLTNLKTKDTVVRKFIKQ